MTETAHAPHIETVQHHTTSVTLSAQEFEADVRVVRRRTVMPQQPGGSDMAGRATAPGQSVIGKVALILGSLADGGRATLTEIARDTGLPMSTVHRLVGELTARRLLTRDDGGVFRPGLPLRTLVVADQEPDVADYSRAVVADLARATGHSARLGVLDGIRVAIVAEGHPRGPTTAAWPTHIPVHATAAGKALLAFSTKPVAHQVISRGLTRLTPTTITSTEVFQRCLSHVRLARIATSCGEHIAGRNTVAVPVFGQGGAVAAALELTLRDLPGDLPVARSALVVAAAALSRELVLAGRTSAGAASRAVLNSAPNPDDHAATLAQWGCSRYCKNNGVTPIKETDTHD